MSGIRIPQTNMDLEPIDPLAPGIVDNGDLAAMPAFTLKGNNTGVSAAPQDIPIDDVLEDIEPYIDIDATLVELAGIIGRAAITGDVTIAAGSNAATIPNGTVTNAKRADMTQSTISGRAAGAGTGAPTDLSASQVQTVIADGWTYLSFGGTVPSAGQIRVPHGFTIRGKSQDGMADRIIFDWGTNGNNEIVIGVFAANHYAMNFQSGGIALYSNTSNILNFNNTRIDMKRDEFRWNQADVTAPILLCQNKTSGAGIPVIVRAGGTTGASAAGANLRLQSGRPGSGGTAGEVRLEGNRDDSTFDVALRAGTSGSAPTLAFYNTAPIVKPTVTGSRGSNAALASLLTALANLGLLTDSSS